MIPCYILLFFVINGIDYNILHIGIYHRTLNKISDLGVLQFRGLVLSLFPYNWFVWFLLHVV